MICVSYRHVSSHQVDASSSKEGTSISEGSKEGPASETSKEGPLSEDLESAEESEKTQTTSDAESVGDLTKDIIRGLFILL